MALALSSHGESVGKQVVLLESIVIIEAVVQAGSNYTIITANSTSGTKGYTLDNSLFGLRNHDGGWKLSNASAPADNNAGLISPPKPRPAAKAAPAPQQAPAAAVGGE